MEQLNLSPGPIGIFDSGFGGLSILKQIRLLMPEYDYLYLGDNARTPYGSRSFQVVYEYTLQCVQKLFQMGSNLVIIACNTASAKALRTIQQKNLDVSSDRRVLGIIRPTAECVGTLTKNKHIGILATPGTVISDSYTIEIGKLFPDVVVSQQECPMLVPLVESGEISSSGTDFFVRKYVQSLLEKDNLIDTIILGCTHYPILYDTIRRYVPQNIRIVTQGEYVAQSLNNYLLRHSALEKCITRGGSCSYYTTESVENFLRVARIFMEQDVKAQTISL